MIRLALLAADALAVEAIRQMVQESHLFSLVCQESPALPAQTVIRRMQATDPEVNLLDIGDWHRVSELVAKINQESPHASIIGFRAQWTPEEQADFAQAGIAELLSEPFSSVDLEAAIYRAVHRRRPVSHPNILVFVPAKAGSGCSTVALNTAGSLANKFDVKTLLVEGDRRSGALSIMLNIENRSGLSEVLARADSLTAMEWGQYVVSIGKLDLLLANPFKPGGLPTWADYYHLLLFIEKQYDFIVVDLPELINPSTSELAKAARTIFIVCQPELTSLTLAGLRQDEMVACEVPREKICVLGNRWEPHRLKREDLVRTAQAPMFAALPNDYEEVKNAALESRLVSRESSFGKACADLARRLSGMPETPPDGPVARFLRHLGKSPS